MARPNTFLIEKLRETAKRIERGDDYNWGSIANCNCGHLAQSITPLTKSDIYEAARSRTIDEWTEYANDYCPHSGVAIDDIIDQMLSAGLVRKDIHDLEYLSNRAVLQALPGGLRYLRKGNPQDVAIYMRTWAGILEVGLKELEQTKSKRASAVKNTEIASV